jgi:hypothetical protein
MPADEVSEHLYLEINVEINVECRKCNGFVPTAGTTFANM